MVAGVNTMTPATITYEIFPVCRPDSGHAKLSHPAIVGVGTRLVSHTYEIHDAREILLR